MDVQAQRRSKLPGAVVVFVRSVETLRAIERWEIMGEVRQ
jgi:hypothetical protein